MYCVAPIARGTAPTYDFWAVGTNCCSKQGSFRCGSYRNHMARGGLRWLRSADRPYFRLAVQQAEATYNISAVHPLFFDWVEDPQETVQTWRAAAMHSFLSGVFSHFVFQAFCVVCATLIFSKIG